jgi:hypothetical protein
MWIAIYEDGRELKQFSEGRENLFKDIDQDRLTLFQVEVNSKKYEVDLADGSFNIDGQKLAFENFGLQNKFQLIYFRRVRQQIGEASNPEVTQCIGWQTNIDGHSFKRILKINNNGGITLCLK